MSELPQAVSPGRRAEGTQELHLREEGELADTLPEGFPQEWVVLVPNRQLQEYQKNAVLSASPVQLIVMLYDGALRFMEGARVNMVERKLEEQNYHLQKAQKIIIELMGSLDMEKGGEVARNLLGLYSFILEELLQANLKDDSTRIENAAKVLRELREGWVGVDRQTRSTEVAHAA